MSGRDDHRAGRPRESDRERERAGGWGVGGRESSREGGWHWGREHPGEREQIQRGARASRRHSPHRRRAERERESQRRRAAVGIRGGTMVGMRVVVVAAAVALAAAGEFDVSDECPTTAGCIGDVVTDLYPDGLPDGDVSCEYVNTTLACWDADGDACFDAVEAGLLGQLHDAAAVQVVFAVRRDGRGRVRLRPLGRVRRDAGRAKVRRGRRPGDVCARGGRPRAGACCAGLRETFRRFSCK